MKRGDSLFLGHIWRECGQPKDGIVADLMRKTKKGVPLCSKIYKEK